MSSAKGLGSIWLFIQIRSPCVGSYLLEPLVSIVRKFQASVPSVRCPSHQVTKQDSSVTCVHDTVRISSGLPHQTSIFGQDPCCFQQIECQIARGTEGCRIFTEDLDFPLSYTRKMLKYLSSKCTTFLSYFTHFPPKSCIPRRANMKMNRRRRKMRLRIDRMLLSREVTKLRRDAQNLQREKKVI